MRCTNIAAFGVRDAFHRWVLPITTPRWRLVPGQEGRHEGAALPPRTTLPTRVHAYEYALDRVRHRGVRGAVRPRAAHRLLLPKRFSNTPACTADPAFPSERASALAEFPEEKGGQRTRGLASQVASAQGLTLYREGRATATTTARPCSFYPNLIGLDTSCRKSLRAANWNESLPAPCGNGLQ